MIPLGAVGSQPTMNGQKTTVPGVEAGGDSGCPFCLARTAPLPEVGDRIQILTDYKAGLIGRVAEIPSSRHLRKGELWVHFDHEPPGIQHMVSLERDLILNSEIPTPIWAPPILLREAAELDDIIVKFCQRGFSKKSWKPHLPTFFWLIRHVWMNRLPLEGTDIWSILEAHGIPQKYKKRLTQLYQDGRDLLVYIIGRKPIKKKRVAPFLPEPPGHWEWDPEVLSGSR